MPPERSRPLHNFTLPRLKWGNQRFLRCTKLNNINPNPNRRSSDHDNNGIDEVREKLMLDLRLAADKMKLSILENKGKQLDNSNPERPWNLRTRRTSNSSENLTIINEENTKTNTKTPKFSITLSREEIEADFLAMTGTKPPRRPKKRPKAVQRQLDALLPGAWLTEVTPESYNVPEYPESGKV